MQRVHVGITTLLAITVIALSFFVWKNGDTHDVSSQVENDEASGRSITRRTDVEEILAELGYQAFIFDFAGGILTGSIASGPADEEIRELRGDDRWTDLQQIIAAKGEAVPDMESLSGRLAILVEPAEITGPTGEAGTTGEEATQAGPTRQAIIHYSLHANDGTQIGAQFKLMLPLTGVASNSEQLVELYANWQTYDSGSYSPDYESNYTFVALDWVKP